MRSFTLVFALILIGFINQLFGQNVNQHYKIFDTKNKKEATINEIANAVRNTDVLFFGEIHNDSIAHIIQDSLYRILINKYKNIALSLEQLSDDKQDILNDYLNDSLTEEKFEQLAEVWMPSHHSYQPLINIAKQNNLPVIAANAPNRFIELVSEKGMNALDSLDEKSKSLLPPLPYHVIKGIYYDNYVSSIKFHTYVTETAYESFCLYDATMAYNIYKFWESNPSYKILHIVGDFHVENNLGAIEQLQHLSNVRFLTISCFYNDFEKPNWNKYKDFSDFVIVTDPTIKKNFWQKLI